jgi:hypothetical protein
MKFKKDLPGSQKQPGTSQIVSIWVHADGKAKVGSAFNLYIKLEEERDKVSVEGSQSQLPPMPIGNAQRAIVYGTQQLELMQRCGWQTLYDSQSKAYAPSRGGQGAGAQRGGAGQAAKGGAKGVTGMVAGRGGGQAAGVNYGKQGMMPAHAQGSAGSGGMRPAMNSQQGMRPGTAGQSGGVGREPCGGGGHMGRGGGGGQIPAMGRGGGGGQMSASSSASMARASSSVPAGGRGA